MNQTEMPPLPSDGWEAARWHEGRRRRRLLDGQWGADLQAELKRQLGTVRKEAWGPVSLALNPFANVTRELAVLYDEPPRITHDQVEAARSEAFGQVIRRAGLWGLMQRVSQGVLGLREYLVAVMVEPRTRRLRFRAVPPDLVIAEAEEGAPDVPVMLRELRLREDPRRPGRRVWTWDVYELRPEMGGPYFRIHLHDGGKSDLGEDVTEAYLGERLEGDAYPWRMGQAARPYLPYVLYHAERTGQLWDPWRLRELVDGTLTAAVLHQMLLHCFRDASWPQRYAVNLRVVGADIVDGDARRTEVVTDPAALLMLESDPDRDTPTQPMVGQWEPGADVRQLEEVLSRMVARLAQEAGVPPSDVQRLADVARSGVAISLTNEGKRKAQRRLAPVFRDADERLMGMVAAELNRAGMARLLGGPLPEGGWQVAYAEVPLSPDEQEARLRRAVTGLAYGLVSRVEAYQLLHPGVPAEAARLRLAEIDAERAALAPTMNQGSRYIVAP